MAGSDKFYVYENWQAGPRKAIIHIGSCGSCKDGRGKAEGYNPDYAKWHGACNDLIQGATSDHQSLRMPILYSLVVENTLTVL